MFFQIFKESSLLLIFLQKYKKAHCVYVSSLYFVSS